MVLLLWCSEIGGVVRVVGRWSERWEGGGEGLGMIWC